MVNDSLWRHYKEIDPCGVCSLRIRAEFCVQCGKWIQGRCTGMKMVTSKFSRNFDCRKCEGNIGKAVKQEEIYVMMSKH